MSMGRRTILDRRAFLSASTTLAATVIAAPGFATSADDTEAFGLGRNQRFDFGWRLFKGNGQGFEAAALDDRHWSLRDLPHDWSIEDLPADAGRPGRIVGPFDQDAGGTLGGYVRGGEAWYRKTFRITAGADRPAILRFDGVYVDCDVWLNGQHVGGHANGYTPFSIDLSPHLVASGINVVAVRVRNLGWTARWHSGSGIYRHVWLDVLASPSRIAEHGVAIRTVEIVAGHAKVAVSSRIVAGEDGLALLSRIEDEAGISVWFASAPAGGEVEQSATIPQARLWSPDAPHLYRLVCELRRGADVIDRTTTLFGVRIVTFDPEHGMRINGAAIKLRGGCIHHDNGLLGAAAFDGAEDRKVALLKARGFNAVRPSHNLFSPAFLDACDRHGMMVVAETFDVWTQHKTPQDYASIFRTHWRTDLEAIVASAAHHPSIMMWSIGNEIPGRGEPESIALQWEIANAVHRLDPTRPVTAAINGFPGHVATAAPESVSPGTAPTRDRTATAFLDLIGYNYKLDAYVKDHDRFPHRILFGTESFPKDLFAIWQTVDRYPWLIGDFVWTAMDYLGEVGIGGSEYHAPSGMPGPARSGRWPWVNAYCGDLDLIGQQKAPSYARDVAWGLSPLELAVRAPAPDGKVEVLRSWGWHDEQKSWSWPGAAGRSLDVQVYTIGDRVDLLLNGVRVGSSPVGPEQECQAHFSLSYSPGVLEAVAFAQGKRIASRKLETVGPPAAVRITPETAHSGDGRRGAINFVALEVVDAQGRLVPDAAVDLKISISGPADLIAFGSANPFAVGSYQSPSAKSWRGRALAVLRSRGSTGLVRIAAESGSAGHGRALMTLKV